MANKKDDFMDSSEDNDELTPFIQKIVGDKDDVIVDYHDYGDGRHKVTIGETVLRIDAWMTKDEVRGILKTIGVYDV